MPTPKNIATELYLWSKAAQGISNTAFINFGFIVVGLFHGRLSELITTTVKVEKVHYVLVFEMTQRLTGTGGPALKPTYSRRVHVSAEPAGRLGGREAVDKLMG